MNASVAASSKTFSKLCFDPKLSQESRREQTLEWQRKRRDDILDAIRKLEESCTDSETEEGMDYVQIVKKKNKKSKGRKPNSNGISAAENNTSEELKDEKEELNEDEEELNEVGEPLEASSNCSISKRKMKKQLWLSNKARRKIPPTSLMHSEWLTKKPEDFEENWIGVLCPVGKRVLVLSNKGKTKVFSRRDQYIGAYSSLLPGGNRKCFSDPGNRMPGVTILDCIWSDESQVFYILDLIAWNSHSCNNCDTEYRQYFLASKIQENQKLLERSDNNPFPFIPLPYFTADNLSIIMTSVYPPFPEAVDGALFFHKEAYYIADTNPLCLWIKLSEVSQMFSVTVTPELLSRESRQKEKDKDNKIKKDRQINLQEDVEA